MGEKMNNVDSAKDVYPHLLIKNNANPNRFLNFPVFSIVIKFILLIPLFLYIWILSIASIVIWIIVPFVIAFTGKYWEPAYRFYVGLIKLSNKMVMYLYGLTDTYPGFNFSDKGLFELTVDMPKNPNKLLGFPLIGFIIRIIVIIPFTLWVNILGQGSAIAYFFTTLVVLFKKKYPESCYEFTYDFIRLSNASTMYMAYMSDVYPSFKISMKHKTIKILLIIAGIVSLFANVIPESALNTYEPAPYTNETMYDSTQDATEVFSDY